MKVANFDNLIPEGILFSIKDIHNMGIIKSDMLRKMILNRNITVVKIGSKNFVDRFTLIDYLSENTVLATS